MDKNTLQEFETEVTETGQITIPQAIRQSMGLHPHDTVSCELDSETAKIRRVSSKLMQGYGAVRARKNQKTIKNYGKHLKKG